jgi:aminopeptidase N
MKDFFTTFQGTQASTEDFKRIVENHFGVDMSWFFNQWVYGTEIPTYSILYKGEQLSNGKYKVHCTIKQKNVSVRGHLNSPGWLITFPHLLRC